jgi:hypothetical protein
MDPQFRTSFIPKKPIVAQTSRATSSVNLFSLLGTVLFIASVALSAGAFFYQGLLTKQIATNKATLERAKDAFEPELINQIIRLDTRIETGKKLLGTHLAVTPFFDFLSSITLRSVRFRDFSFSYLAADKIVVAMKGQAQSYASVALQSDVFSAQKSIKNTLLSDMALDPTGTVTFSVSTTINPSLVSYETSVSGGSATSTKNR